MIEKAIIAINPNASFSSGENIDRVRWHDGNPLNITKEQIQAKIAELEAAEPLRQLRIQRNQLLTQTDWRMTTDYPYADQAEWASYRTQLRNLPQTATPTLDENGNLIVNWPQAPDAV